MRRGPWPGALSTGSWWMTTIPSEVAWTSSSMASAPSSIARRKAGMEFSGSVWCAPRWEIVSGAERRDGAFRHSPG